MKRLIAAFVNSLEGLRYGFANEAAIRLELICIACSIPIVPFITLDPWRMLLMWGSLLLILLAELLNTAIEALADKITLEISPEIKIAKDCGSAAVTVAALIAAGVWGIAIYEWWFAETSL